MPSSPLPVVPALTLRRIIGLALLLALVTAFTACSMVRLAYDQAPNLLYWRIDSYVDVNGEQTPRLRDAIERWFAWHRRTQLPEYVALLVRAQREIVEPMTPAGMCAWAAETERRVDALLEEALPATAELLPTLTPEQLQHIERRMAKGEEEWRVDVLQPDLAERRAASLRRSQDRFEMLYGRLDAAQRERLSALLATSSFDPARWLAERRLRNRDMLQILANVGAVGRNGGERAAALQQAQAAARALFERATHSPRPDYRAYQQRLLQENCALAASMHNAMTIAQRQNARARLKGWEDDLRVLITAGPGNGATASR